MLPHRRLGRERAWILAWPEALPMTAGRCRLMEPRAEAMALHDFVASTRAVITVCQRTTFYPEPGARLPSCGAPLFRSRA